MPKQSQMEITYGKRTTLVAGVDTCATKSVFGHLHFFENFSSLACPLKLADNSTIRPSGSGLIKITLIDRIHRTMRLNLPGVYLPGAQLNLISVKDLLRQGVRLNLQQTNPILQKGKKKSHSNGETVYLQLSCFTNRCQQKRSTRSSKTSSSGTFV